MCKNNNEKDPTDQDDELPQPEGLGHDLLDRLSPKQIRFRDAFLRGLTVTDAAEVAGVSRPQASDWKNNNPDVKASLNRGKRDLARRLRTRRNRVKEKALKKVEEGVDRGDPDMIKLAVKEVPAEEPDESAPTRPAQIAVQERVERALAEDQARFAYMHAVLLRLLSGRRRERLADKLREASERPGNPDEAHKLLWAAEFLEKSVEASSFDTAAPKMQLMTFLRHSISEIRAQQEGTGWPDPPRGYRPPADSEKPSFFSPSTREAIQEIIDED